MKMIKRLLGSGENNREKIMLPCFMKRELMGKAALFEAVVPDDPIRISLLCSEEAWWQEIVNFLREDDCFWDVGSFIGLLTVYAAQKCSAGHVVAIEPEPDFMKRVSRHIELNHLDNVLQLNLGISDAEGVLPLNTSGVEGWSPSFFKKELKQWVEVPVKTIDQLCEQYPKYMPTVMKIDVEGFEGKVLAGAVQTLQSKKLRAIFMELHPNFLNENNEPVWKVLYFLENSGFVLKEFHPRETEVHILAIKK